MTQYTRHYRKTVEIDAPAPAVFLALDDHERLAEHMMRSSTMMAGQAMKFQFGPERGRAVGSCITMSGRILGIDLFVDEFVVERLVPVRKVWETAGKPRLLVIGPYRMGFSIESRDARSILTVFIDYRLPSGPLLMAGLLLGPLYARWCVDSMALGARKLFEPRHHGHLPQCAVNAAVSAEGGSTMQVQPTCRLSVMRVAAAGAASAAIFYAFCWLGAFLPVGPATHAYLELFTSADLTSASALIQGICWSLAFGLVAGGLFALFYNALGVLDRG